MLKGKNYYLLINIFELIKPDSQWTNYEQLEIKSKQKWDYADDWNCCSHHTEYEKSNGFDNL